MSDGFRKRIGAQQNHQGEEQVGEEKYPVEAEIRVSSSYQATDQRAAIGFEFPASLQEIDVEVRTQAAS